MSIRQSGRAGAAVVAWLVALGLQVILISFHNSATICYFANVIYLPLIMSQLYRLYSID
jgi:hypothetical protein